LWFDELVSSLAFIDPVVRGDLSPTLFAVKTSCAVFNFEVEFG